jgi:hypothetical protein
MMLSVEDIFRRLAVEEVGGHEELERDLWRDGKLGDLGGTVGVAHLKGNTSEPVRISCGLILSFIFYLKMFP